MEVGEGGKKKKTIRKSNTWAEQSGKQAGQQKYHQRYWADKLHWNSERAMRPWSTIELGTPQDPRE